jgi:uncharacterized repeat protein (TIGR03843 family)
VTEALADTEVEQVLRNGELTLNGRLLSASNATFVGRSTLDDVSGECVYKPVRGEKPLWDFPDGTLAGREVAAHQISELAGWGLVPVTVLTDGPFGIGMAQRWIDEVDDAGLVDIVASNDLPDGWLHVLDAVDAADRQVSLVHADVPALRSMSILDAVINNADRKGGHVLVDPQGRVHGCDHGVTMHVEDKLRTVLWGWAGEPLAEPDVAALDRLASRLGETQVSDRLCELLTGQEVTALRRRVRRLLRNGVHPFPSRNWPAIPWPAF